MEVGTKKKEEVPEDFMPKDASKKIEHNPKGESPKERLGEHPQKESRGETNQEPVQLPLKPTSLKEKLEAQEPPKPIETASAPVPKMNSAPLPKNFAASKPEPPNKTKDEVTKSVAEAISKANSKEENLARIQAYLDELKAKNPQAKSTPPTDIKPDKGEEKEPNKEGAKDLDKTLESIQDLPDPVMPAGALNPPFVPTLILPESPNAESISLELKIETEDALEPATKGLDEATKESQEASLSSLQASGPDTKGEQPPKEIIEAKDSSVNEAMYPSLEGSTTKTEVPETTPSVQIEPERNFEEAKQEQSQDSKPQKEEVEPLLSEEKKPKSSKAKKMPSEGYRSFADWLRQTKG